MFPSKALRSNDIPYKFEAGTPNIGDVIAFQAAMDFITDLGYEEIAAYEHDLLMHATQKMSEVQGLKIIGNSQNKASVVSFVLDGIHPYDVGQLLDARGIAVRTGHHCTQPLMDFFCIEGTIRASFSVYNTLEEIDFFCQSLKEIVAKFA